MREKIGSAMGYCKTLLCFSKDCSLDSTAKQVDILTAFQRGKGKEHNEQNLSECIPVYSSSDSELELRSLAILKRIAS